MTCIEASGGNRLSTGIAVEGAGRAFAYSYYSGYLRLLLTTPPEGTSFEERIEKFEKDHSITLATRKLIVIVPTFPLFISDFETYAPGRINIIGNLASVSVSRAGMKKRPYTAVVYSLRNKDGKDAAFVTMDLPAILQTLYEMCESQTTGCLEEEVTMFIKTLEHLSETDPLCRNSFQLIPYSGKDDKGQDIDMVTYIRDHLKSNSPN